MFSAHRFDISVAPAAGEHHLAVTFQSPHAELNVWLTREDAVAVLKAASAGGASPAVAAGDSAGAKVFWTLGEGGLLSVVVGEDDEAWDVAFALSKADCNELQKQLRASLG